MGKTSTMDKPKNLISSSTGIKFYLGLGLISIIYLILRLIYPETIEFGYDQPRLAYTVMDYLKNGNFMTLQTYSLPTSWGNLSWGPTLVLFNSLFLKISHDPFVISYLMIFFNFLSIFIVAKIGNEYFSWKVGLVAALVFSVHPLWIIFSRMIYQPAPIPVFIAASIYFLFKVIKNPKSVWIIPLVVSWAMLLQMYLITISFVFLSFIFFLIFSNLKLNYKYLLISIGISLLLYLPSIKYYLDNKDLFYKFLQFGGKFNTSFTDTLKGFFNTIIGGNFKWQLGYGYEDFVKNFRQLKSLQSLVGIFLSFLLTIGIYGIFKKLNHFGIMLLLFFIAPLFAIPLIGVEYVVPRYFLYIMPAFSLFVGISVEETVKLISKKIYLILLFILLFWVIFIFKYYYFIKTYQYPSGFISNWSDVPYSFLQKSFAWIEEDSKNKNYDTYTVSLDPKKPKEFNLNYSQRYYWEYVVRKDEILTGNIGHYLMHFTPLPEDSSISVQQYGPYVVYEYVD